MAGLVPSRRACPLPSMSPAHAGGAAQASSYARCRATRGPYSACGGAARATCSSAAAPTRRLSYGTPRPARCGSSGTCTKVGTLRTLQGQTAAAPAHSPARPAAARCHSSRNRTAGQTATAGSVREGAPEHDVQSPAVCSSRGASLQDCAPRGLLSCVPLPHMWPQLSPQAASHGPAPHGRHGSACSASSAGRPAACRRHAGRGLAGRAHLCDQQPGRDHVPVPPGGGSAHAALHRPPGGGERHQVGPLGCGSP